MLVPIVMPQLGESVTEGTIDRWLKREGDWIGRDEPLVEVITDKVNAEVPSPVAGRLVRITVADGRTVSCHAEIAVIETEAASTFPGDRAVPRDPAVAARSAAGDQGHLFDPSVSDQPTRAAADDSVPESVAARSEAALEESAESRFGQSSGSRAGRAMGSPDDLRPGRQELAALEPEEALRRRTTPVVRRLATQHGVDLSRVPGTGFGGRVRKQDLLAYLDQPRTAVSTGVRVLPDAPAPLPADASSLVGQAAAPPVAISGHLLALTPARRTIAERMTTSLRTAPQVTTVFEMDVTALVALRARHRASFARQTGTELSYLILFIKAVVENLARHPLLNASWSDDGIQLHDTVNIGVAVAAPSLGEQAGSARLVVPVVHGADRLNMKGLALATTDLVTRARSGKLRPEDVQGGTCTVNNTGALGSLVSTPILYLPQAAMVTLEAIVKRPVVVTDTAGGDSIAIRSMAYSCLTFDHRVLDGFTACAFMRDLKRSLEASDERWLDGTLSI